MVLTQKRQKPSSVSVESIALEEFDVGVLKKAVSGLTRYISGRSTNDDLLDQHGATVTLTFNMEKIPPGISSKPLEIGLPYPIHCREDTAVCLIVRDPQKKWKEKISEVWNTVEVNGMEKPKVIGISNLRKKYPTMASKRELCRAYDFFLCDTRVVDQMPRVLGRTFITAGKLPIEVPVKESSLFPSICTRLHQTFLSVRTGPSLSVKIGRSNDDVKHLYQNALTTIAAVAAFFKGVPNEDATGVTRDALLRDNTIKTIHLTATNAPSLPIYILPSLRHSLATKNPTAVAPTTAAKENAASHSKSGSKEASASLRQKKSSSRTSTTPKLTPQSKRQRVSLA